MLAQKPGAFLQELWCTPKWLWEASPSYKILWGSKKKNTTGLLKSLALHDSFWNEKTPWQLSRWYCLKVVMNYGHYFQTNRNAVARGRINIFWGRGEESSILKISPEEVWTSRNVLCVDVSACWVEGKATLALSKPRSNMQEYMVDVWVSRKSSSPRSSNRKGVYEGQLTRSPTCSLRLSHAQGRKRWRKVSAQILEWATQQGREMVRGISVPDLWPRRGYNFHLEPRIP